MDFRRSTAPSWMSPREQRRLLLLVLLLGLVLWMMVQVRRPHMWHWIEGGEATPPAGGQSAPPSSDAPQGPQPLPTDHRAAPFDEEHTTQGVFRSPAANRQSPTPAVLTNDWQIDPERLRAIRDNTPFRAVEHEAWFAMWGRLQSAPPAELTAPVGTPVSYAQLDRQPEAWRGRLVTLRGLFHRAMPARAPANGHGIGRYFEVWLEPTEAPALPVVVHCLELPPGFPQGMQIRAEGAVTGYFFKRWLYDAQDGLRTAPLVVARTIERSSPTTTGRPPSTGEGISLLILSMLIGLGAAGWLFFRVAPQSTSRAKPRKPERIEFPTHKGD